MHTIIITGATGNLGKAVVKKFLAGNYRVIGTVLPGDQPVQDGKDKNFEMAEVDLLNEDAVVQFADQLVSRYKNIDAAVLTAGGFDMGHIAETRSGDILKQYRLNFETAYNLVRPVFLQMMKQGSGRIFLIGSRPGYDMNNSKGMVAYGLTKSLIFRLAELMNMEAKGTDVVTHVIVPSTIDTPSNRKNMPDADFNKWVTPEAIAEVIYYYCSDEASIIREPVIKVYGNS